MPLIIPANTLVPSGYDVENSIRLDGSAYMHKTQSGGNRQIFTMSCWTKLTGAYGSNAGSLLSTDGTDDDSNFHFGVDNGGGSGGATDSLFLHIYGADGFTTTPFLRDYAAWYHVVLAVDTTQSTSSNRMKLYVNNVQQTLTEGSDYPAQNDNFGVNESGTVIGVGTHPGSVATYALNSYLAEYCLIDGLQLTPSSFGEANEDSPTIWQPIDPSGLTFGTNGFYLDFKDSANLGNDANGGTDWDENNIAATNSSTDTPTNNFATWNSVIKTTAALVEGNLKYTTPGSNPVYGSHSTIGVTAGKWYAELNYTSGASHKLVLGVADDNFHNGLTTASYDIGKSGTANSIAYVINTGDYRINNSNTSWGSGGGDGDIINMAMDRDNGKLYFGVNNTWGNSSDPAAGSNGIPTSALDSSAAWFFGITSDTSGTGDVGEINFGNPSYANSSDAADANGYGAFEYAPPSGFLALCTKNLGSDGG